MPHRNIRRLPDLSTNLYTFPGTGKQKGSPAMLSSLGLAATAIGPALFIIATCVALGTVLATWARIPPASAMQPAGGHRDTITITIRNTTVAYEKRRHCGDNRFTHYLSDHLKERIAQSVPITVQIPRMMAIFGISHE